VEPPDINVSDANFTPHGGAIRFGLAAVKNVGHTAIESIVAARQKLGRFRSIFEFCESVDLRLLNKRVIESLIKSGALDPLGRRGQLMAVIDRALERGQKAQRDAESGQHGLFGVFGDEPHAAAPAEKLPDVPDWEEPERLAAEKEILGFFITGHPLEKYREKLEQFRALDSEAILALRQGTGRDEIFAGGLLTGLRVLRSKKGEQYAQGVLEDLTGSVDVLIFPEAFRRLGERVRLEVPVLVRGGVRVEEGANPKLTVSEITPLEEAQPKLPRSLRIRVPLEAATPGTIDALCEICRQRKGEAKVLFDVERPGDFLAVMEAEGYNVLPDRAFIARVEELCGRGSVRIVD
jgi:DNA polymerase-3 subunit alpha